MSPPDGAMDAFTILLADDDEEDRGLALDAMRDCDLDDQMKFLNMPRLDGREALARIRADESHPRRGPDHVNDEADVMRTYELGVNSFITKPGTFTGLVEVTRTWSQYWFEVVDLPMGLLGDH